MSLIQLLRIIKGHRWKFILISLATIVLAALASLMLPKKYTAESAVVIDMSSNNPVSGNAESNMAPQLQPAYVATQVDVLSSHNVALKVVDKLDLTRDARYRNGFQHATGGKGSLRDWIADALINSLKVRSSHNGNVIFVEYTGREPVQTAAIANAFSEGYIQTTLDLKTDSARHQAGWFENQLQDLRNNLETAQQKLSAYQNSEDVIGIDDARLDVENSRLEELSNQLVGAQSAMYQATARERQMNEATTANQLGELSDVLKSPLLQNLQTELARAEANFAHVSQRFDHNHPEYQSAAAQLNALQAKVASEINNTKSSLRRDASVARQQVTGLQKAIEEQRDRILSMKHVQDSYSVLKHDVDNARTAYDNAMQRGDETRLESRLDRTNAAILNRAVVPVDPSSPRVVLNLILAVLLGPMLALGVCLIGEMSNQRIHDRDDLGGTDPDLVLAEIPPSSPGSTLFSWPRSRGTPPRRKAPVIDSLA